MGREAAMCRHTVMRPARVGGHGPVSFAAMSAFLRRILRAAREQPVVAVAAVVVFLAAAVGSAVAVASTGDDDPDTTDTAATTTTTSSSTTTTSTTSTTTTAAPESTTTTIAPTTTTSRVPSGRKCVVRLHGKGGNGTDSWVEDGVTFVNPRGNARGWGGWQWLYFPDDKYASAVATVADAIADEGCGPVIINGFSNGAAFAAKLYCKGETFGSRVIGVVIDDPVVDSAVEGCSPASGVAATLYWTGDLESTARPGWNCKDGDWTCEGGRTIGIDAYEEALGVTAKESPYDEHQWYEDAPEITRF